MEGEERENLIHVAFLVLRVNLLKDKRTGILDQADRVQGFSAYWLHRHWLVTNQKQKRKYERKRKKRVSTTEIDRRGKAQQKEEEEGKHNRKRRRGKAQERERERALHA